ncbi:MAG TPA: NUDIX hydrolase [Gillisia sp.]|nr:NUDIX hydrolase [Gillisia sp.]
MAKQNIDLTVDAVVFSKNNDLLKVLLIKRKNDPYKDQWALPGGFLEDHETLEKGTQRELEEETGIKTDNMRQVGIFADPGRDPRGRVISIAFTTLISHEVPVKGNDDATDAKWFDINALPKLAFDHSEIIERAKNML